MARIRTIKPEFWADEELSEVSEPALILAAALLNYSDDEGFFKAHPGLIRAACFPLREPSQSIHGMITELSNIGYIRLFEGSDGKQYGQIVNFSKHQRVSRPTPSKIKELIKFTESSVSPQCGKGKEQGKEQGKERKGLSSAKALEVGIQNSDPAEDSSPESQHLETQPDRVPVQQIVDLYHEVLPELPKVQKITETRRGYIRQRWREDLQELDHWRNFFLHVRNSPFLMGKAPGQGDKPPFIADLEWLTKPANFAKIAEDKYHRRMRAVR